MYRFRHVAARGGQYAINFAAYLINDQLSDITQLPASGCGRTLDFFDGRVDTLGRRSERRTLEIAFPLKPCRLCI
jgi:hypothetical protein